MGTCRACGETYYRSHTKDDCIAGFRVRLEEVKKERDDFWKEIEKWIQQGSQSSRIIEGLRIKLKGAEKGRDKRRVSAIKILMEFTIEPLQKQLAEAEKARDEAKRVGAKYCVSLMDATAKITEVELRAARYKVVVLSAAEGMSCPDLCTEPPYTHIDYCSVKKLQDEAKVALKE